MLSQIKSWAMRGGAIAIVLGASTLGVGADPVNVAKGSPGELPKADDGRALNLDFETGTLADWTADGKAFDQQPIKGPIDQKRIYGEGKFSAHTGQFWIGGFEKLQDGPTGTLTSASFTVTHPFASFLIGGGAHAKTRVELVQAEDDKVFYKASGRDDETMRPVIVDMKGVQGKKIFVRVIDDHPGGWGHVNFDDFRFHAKRPEFAPPAPPAASDLVHLYPHAGLDAKAAAAAMQVPPGFRVQVGAAEPDVQQPVAMALDDRGRVWIAEAYEYPRRAAAEGRDRILVFEDTNGDGTLDKRTVFAEKLNLVSGLEVGFGGVWVGAAPQLLFIPDRDRDDVPDGPPEVLLDGWGFQDTHETLNAFIWGPDGWLYGCHGVFTHSEVGKPGTPKERRTKLNAGIWRYHPTRHQFEVFAEGTSNPWGVDFDDHGQAFATACVIPHLFHVIQGARYERQAGNHFNPHTYADIKTIADHRHYTGNQWNNNDRRSSDSLGGGHAHAGAMIYLGDAWPRQFRHQLFMNNIHGNRVNVDVLKRDGSGFIGSHGEDFLLTRDQWSQMLYLTYGPDGNVWVIDWYDATQCHRNEPEIPDRTNGRIYRVVYDAPAATGGAAAVAATAGKVDVATAADGQLVGWQSHANDWYVRHARRVLQERAASGKLDAGTPAALAKLTLESPETRIRLRALWALHAVGGLTEDLALQLLASDRSEVRAWTLQLAAEEVDDAMDPAPATAPAAKKASLRQSPALQKRLAELASQDESPQVRLYVASALQRLPAASRWDALAGLASHAADAQDHNLPLMIWYAAEPLADVDADRALAWAVVAGSKIPLLQDYMIRRIGSGDANKSLALLAKGLAAATSPQQQLSFLGGINAALAGRPKVEAPAGWQELFGKLTQSSHDEVRLQTLVLGATFGTADAAPKLRGLVADAKQPLAARQQALAALLKVKDSALAPLLRQQLADAGLRRDALRGLAAFDDAETPRAILTVYGELPLADQRDALATLSSRVSFATALLEAVEKKQIPAGHLTAELVRQLVNLKDENLAKQIERTWGTVRESTADRAALIAHYKRLVTEPVSPGLALRPLDVELGRAVFVKTCQQCHTLFGKGGKVGPDLTGSNRANLDYLLSNVLDPSAVMAKEYQPTIVVANGRVLTGIVRATTADAITLQTANETVIVPRGDIDEMKPSEKSMMPDDLLKHLQPHEVRALVAYLGGAGQTPILATDDTLKSFFNGQDLSGWVGELDHWKVENGEIVGRSPGLKHNEFLVSELAVENFRLTVDVKLAPNAENSGIQFRSQPQADGEVKGYQADIGQGWWGKLYEEHGRELLWKMPGDKHVKPNDWNKYEIVAVGSRIRTWINGQPCVDLDDPEGARRGVIALQLHSGGAFEVRFRNLKLERLPTDATPPTGQPFPVSRGGPAKGALAFERKQLDPRFRSEGVAYGDFNNDGLLDIAAGSVWYEAPDWAMHVIAEKPREFDIRTYGDTFCNWAEDVDGDGRLDLVVVDFPGKPTWWFQNPGNVQTPWKKHQLTAVTNNESPTFVDLDRDGRRELLCGVADGRTAAVRRPTKVDGDWKVLPISAPGDPKTERFTHGLGVGDVNGDGRDDVLGTGGWWEAPEPGKGDVEWKFHAAPFGQACSQMYVFDFDGDGDQDVVSASAHRVGMWWHEQTEPGQWKTHEIDKSIAQTHAVVLADMNGDGLPDLVTGKRYFAHNGNDPGENEPPLLAWYELKRVDGKAQWTRHVIDEDSGVGTQFEVVDMDRDGLLDVIVANKHGVYYFRQKR